jgi:hypothetical protein
MSASRPLAGTSSGDSWSSASYFYRVFGFSQQSADNKQAGPQRGFIIDACLSKRDGHLWIEAIDTMAIVARHPTPVFVISENQLRRNVRRFQKARAE